MFPSGVRVIGIDWRGCGESYRPPPAADFSNYSMRQHALDMLAALDELQIPFCHLATHSTGGSWSGAWRRSGIRIWCCGATRMDGLLLPISGPWQQRCRIAG
ncbi:alpha/beta fold hydrolase [Bradyrhizobium sp. TZ2]